MNWIIANLLPTVISKYRHASAGISSNVSWVEVSSFCGNSSITLISMNTYAVSPSSTLAISSSLRDDRANRHENYQ